ncbi:MAG: hypothetical protein SFU53_05580 [Terrimicrobiaceae bacterium]|nr:hypothetical protein [Terrimicrobiaceae bacterium]
MRSVLFAILLALAIPGWAPAVVDVPAASCCCADAVCDVHASGTKCACPLPTSVSAQAPAVLASASTFSAPPAADTDFFSQSAFAPSRTDRPLSPPPKFTA